MIFSFCNKWDIAPSQDLDSTISATSSLTFGVHYTGGLFTMGSKGASILQYLLEELPQLATTKNPELLEAYLPWHPNIQEKFKENDKIPY